MLIFFWFKQQVLLFSLSSTSIAFDPLRRNSWGWNFVLTIVLFDFRYSLLLSLSSTSIAFDHFGETPEAEILFPTIFWHKLEDICKEFKLGLWNDSITMQHMYNPNTSGTRVGPGFRDQTPAVIFFLQLWEYPRSGWKAIHIEKKKYVKRASLAYVHCHRWST